MERELKYSSDDPSAFEALASAAEIAGYPAGAAQDGTYRDQYLDAADRRIFQAGYACRVRQGPQGWQATLKGLGGARGAWHAREEVEAPAGDGGGPVDWPDSPARDLALQLAGDAPLAELFTLRQARIKRMLGPAGAPVAELSLDDVQVEIGGRTVARYHEVEAEQSAAGMPDDMARIATALEALGLQAEGRSKFERALALLDESGAAQAVAPPPARPKNPGVAADDTLAEAARKVLRFHCRRMLEHEKGAESGEDPEGVHDMRVATRRMRAALRLFGAAFTGKALKPFRKGLRATAQALGEVRDRDVLIAHVQEYQAGLSEPGAAALAPLIHEWQAQQAQARDALQAYLASKDYRDFRDAFALFLETPGAGVASPARDDPLAASAQLVRYSAGAMIWQHYQTVQTYETLVRWAPIEVLHTLRIEGKRLRYTLEFFREVLGPETPHLIAVATAMQDHFGALHDDDVAVAQVRAFLMRHAGPDLSPVSRQAIAGYLLARERHLRLLVKGAPRAWRTVGGTGFRRRLARAIAAL